MSFVLLPDIILPALTDVTPELLSSRGITWLLLDFDNTIVPYTTNEPTPEMAAWIERMQASPVQLCVVSNSKRQRMPDFCRKYGINYIARARKPFQRGIREAIRVYRLDPAHTALVGDQIYTDVLGANCGGLTSILISAIHNHTFLLKLRHVAELPFIALGRLSIAAKARRDGKSRQKS